MPVSFGSGPFDRERYVLRSHAGGVWLVGATELALRTGAPIYVADWIFDEAGVDAVIEDAGYGEDEEPPH